MLVVFEIQGWIWHQLGWLPWQAANSEAHLPSAPRHGMTIMLGQRRFGLGQLNGLFTWSRRARFLSWPPPLWERCVQDQQLGKEELTVGRSGSGTHCCPRKSRALVTRLLRRPAWPQITRR